MNPDNLAPLIYSMHIYDLRRLHPIYLITRPPFISHLKGWIQMRLCELCDYYNSLFYNIGSACLNKTPASSLERLSLAQSQRLQEPSHDPFSQITSLAENPVSLLSYIYPLAARIHLKIVYLNTTSFKRPLTLTIGPNTTPCIVAHHHMIFLYLSLWSPLVCIPTSSL